MHFRLPPPQFQECRLVAFGGIEFIDKSSFGDAGFERSGVPEKENQALDQAGPRKEIADAHKRAEEKDRDEEGDRLTKLENEIDSTDDETTEKDALRARWLEDIRSDLRLGDAKLTLGAPKIRLRTPAEQYGIYVDGEHVGDICAGFENGTAVRDPDKYDRSAPPYVGFNEQGFKDQVQNMEPQIKAKLEQ